VRNVLTDSVMGRCWAFDIDYGSKHGYSLFVGDDKKASFEDNFV